MPLYDEVLEKGKDAFSKDEIYRALCLLNLHAKMWKREAEQARPLMAVIKDVARQEAFAVSDLQQE